MVKVGKPNETNRERFLRLATARTKAVLEKIRVLGHCSNHCIYEYSDEDIKDIFKAIEKELDIAKAKFRISNHRTNFKLKR